MTGDDLFTHQLPRASRECAPDLARQHPDLAAIVVPAFADELAVRTWLDEQVARFGEFRDVAPMNPADHTSIDPLTEFSAMRPGMPVVPVLIDAERKESR